jgi:choline dehydrogenase-like flavoprotein
VFKFSSHLLPHLSGRDNYRLLCNTKVVRLLRDGDSTRIRAAECLDTETQQRFLVEAKAFVLAAGALETPRILLNSRDDAFPDGLANRSGTLGCYLQDSIKVLVGSSLLRLVGNRQKYDPGFSDNLLIPRFLFDNKEFRGGFQAQVCHFRPKYPYYLDGLAPYPGWLKKRLAKLLFRTYLALAFFGKSEIQRSNRVVSSQERDTYGIPQVDVHYEYTESDRRMQQSMIAWGRRILRKCSGLICFSLTDDLAGPGIHYAGTCRMADQSTEGVVDANLQCFDHPNLYVCDGSVMPDMSEKNLTLTIMALADRLARCLSDQLH